MKGEDEIIKEEIRRLHDRGSGNYEQLISQVETRKRKIRLNLPQVMAMVARQEESFPGVGERYREDYPYRSTHQSAT
jgi:hypothetical protein